MLKVLIAQNNYTVGDFEGNFQKIIASLQTARNKGCSLVVTSELALTGYPPRDLLTYPLFLQQHDAILKRIGEHTKGLTLLVGCLRQNLQSGAPLFNSCAVFQDGQLTQTYDKQLLPTYDVFDETRYFQPGSSSRCILVDGKKVAITICEDLWFEKMERLYHQDPLEKVAHEKPDLLVNLSASPFEVGKLPLRIKLCQKAAQKLSCPVILSNQVGGNDSLIFDGHSLVVDANGPLHIAKGFAQDNPCIDLSQRTLPPSMTEDMHQLYDALCIGIRDYFHKQDFKKAIIGLSGGIDSALVCALAAEALGKENILAISMPSRFSSKHSQEDAKKLSDRLGVRLITVPIEQVHASYLKLLEKPFGGPCEGVTDENLQSRIRGMILMAFSNKFNHLVISCGNKSEMAMGYATLYGDLTGGLSAISDLTKTQVYQLANWINRDQEVILQSIIDKPPSAELRPDQKDSDSLPDYGILDSIIVSYLETHKSADDISKEHHIDLKLVSEVIAKIHRSEYKRSQSPIGLKVTSKSFSTGWQFPIVHKIERKP